MGLFNNICVQERCPVCGVVASIVAQTHFATHPMYCLEDYRLGDTMAWWPREDQRFRGWREDSIVIAVDDNVSREACYSRCENCDAQVCVVIEFHGFVPTSVLLVARKEDWPDGYPC